MAWDPNFANLSNYTPYEWFAQIPFPQNVPEAASLPSFSDPVYRYELLLMETQLNTQSTDTDDTSSFDALGSTSTTLLPFTPSFQPVVFFPPKWHVIPQGIYSQNQWDYTPSDPILFQVDGFPGLNMGDALRGNFAALKGRDDLVMGDIKKAFQYRLLFPGYPIGSYQVHPTYWNKARDPIPRSKLAHELAKKLEQYLNLMVSSHTMDPSVGRQWQIGQGFMHLDNMFLARLESASRGSYQPVLYVVDPTM